MKKCRSRIALVSALVAWSLAVAYASSSYMNSFNSTYSASRLVNDCSVCHTSVPNLNAYGNDYRNNGRSLTAIQNFDSDNDGFSNITEINAGTYPGDSASKPNVDSTPPSITLGMPSISSNLTIAITVAAADNVGVTGYLVNENPTKPSVNASGWTANPPTSYAFQTEGAKTLYAWAKDAAGNIGGNYGTVMITLPDQAPPSVTLNMPPSSGTLTVTIAVGATDNVGVTGYLVNENPTKPSASASGWAASAPASYTFQGGGAKTLYAWAKDAAGNVGGASGTVTIALPDQTPPSVTLGMPSSSSNVTVGITVAATDNVGVTGYLVNENSTKPSSSASGWTTSAPASYTFQGGGAKTLYAWAKDAAGNVGGASGTVTIALPDQTPPSVTLKAPASSSSLTVPITVTASDNVGVTGYMVSEGMAALSADTGEWQTSAPTSYTFQTGGTKTLYALAKDAAGNVGSQSATITVTLPQDDTTAPVITSFSMPATASSLTVHITSFTATDNVGVTGYFVAESDSTPSADTAGWTSNAPASHTFSTSGSKILYAWVKDAAGNISAVETSETDIEITGPDLSGMTIWTGQWFRLAIRNAEKGSFGRGYLNILSLEDGNQTLSAVLFTQDEQGNWQSADLSIHYTSGTPLRFLSWFDYAEEFAFSVSITGVADKNGNLRNANIKAVGIAFDEANEAQSDEDVKRTFSIAGTLVSDGQVPVEISGQSGEDNTGKPSTRLRHSAPSPDMSGQQSGRLTER